MTTYPLGQELRHLDLNIIGIVESEIAIGIHQTNLRREMVNVRVEEYDNIWWDVTRVIPVTPESVSPAPLTTPVVLEPVTNNTIAPVLELVG